MAEPYLTELRKFGDDWIRADPAIGALECRHFFSGAAAYRNDAIVATLTPVGLAFKVSAALHNDLLAHELAVELRYFPDAPVKQNYVLFPSGSIESDEAARLILT